MVCVFPSLITLKTALIQYFIEYKITKKSLSAKQAFKMVCYN